MHDWISPALVGLALLLNLARDLRKSGKRDQQLETNTDDITTLKGDVKELSRKTERVWGHLGLNE